MTTAVAKSVKTYYDVAFQVGDVLLLDDSGQWDADPWEMEERCTDIIEHYCHQWNLTVPVFRTWRQTTKPYDSVQVRDYYIKQLLALN